MAYWVYENTRANGHVARIHRSDCGNCNDGQGKRGGTRADNGRWLGPFDSLTAADEAARATGGTRHACHWCVPTAD